MCFNSIFNEIAETINDYTKHVLVSIHTSAAAFSCLLIMSVSSDLMGGGCPKATSSITVLLGVGLCWPQVVLEVTLATCGVVLWVPVTKFEVMPGVQQSACD